MNLLWILTAATLAAADEFAVLVAGSSGFWNYRHQADVCHAYQVLVSRGFNPANIVLFSYDDVPSDAINPFPGQLFNHPGNSPDVNAGCVKDYTGTAVNTNNFLAVLTRNTTALKGGNGKVLHSGPNDNVFIYFADHGAPGMVAFPSTYLYADQLIAAFNYMHENQMYQKLVFYLEACESGSMFDGLLPNNTGVYVVTSADPTEASWGTYCPPDDAVQGTELYTCLGDLFSISWMEDSDVANFSVETLQQQFELVQTRTNESHVSQYGDFSFTSDTLNQFQGLNTTQGRSAGGESVEWNARFIKLQYLSTLAATNPSQENLQALDAETTYRQQTQLNFENLAMYLSPADAQSLLNDVQPVSDYSCLRAAVDAYEANCGALGEFGMMFVQVLVNACAQFAAQVQTACQHVCPAPAFKL